MVSDKALKEKAKAIKEKEKAKAIKEKEKAKAIKDKEKAKAIKDKEKAKEKAIKKKEKAKAIKDKAKVKTKKDKSVIKKGGTINYSDTPVNINYTEQVLDAKFNTDEILKIEEVLELEYSNINTKIGELLEKSEDIESTFHDLKDSYNNVIDDIMHHNNILHILELKHIDRFGEDFSKDDYIINYPADNDIIKQIYHNINNNYPTENNKDALVQYTTSCDIQKKYKEIKDIKTK